MKMLSTTLLGLIAVLLLQSCDVSVSYGYGYPCGYYSGCGGYGRGWHRGHRRHRRHHNILVNNFSAVANEPSDASLLAADYGIKLSSAEKILDVAANTEGREEAIRALRLSQEDLTVMKQFEMPSSYGVNKMARALDEKPEVLEKLIADFLKDAKAAQ